MSRKSLTGFYLDVTNRCIYHLDASTGDERDIFAINPDREWPAVIESIWNARREGWFDVDEAERLTRLCSKAKSREATRKAEDAAQVSEWAVGWGAQKTAERVRK